MHTENKVPYGWVAVCVLGTFITEWDDGFEKCSYLLSDMSIIERFVDQMVNIAVHHSMDGWLINIENKIQVGIREWTKLEMYKSRELVPAKFLNSLLSTQWIIC